MAKSDMEHDAFLRVVAMDEAGARSFATEWLGVGRIARVLDGGPPGDPAKYKSGARCYHVYIAGDLRAVP